MDPNAALAELRAAIADLRESVANLEEAADGDSNDAEFAAARNVADEANRVAEHIEALDTWLSRGGFLPTAWHHYDTQDQKD